MAALILSGFLWMAGCRGGQEAEKEVTVDEYGLPIMMSAALEGDLDEVIDQIERHPEHINAVDDRSDRTALIFAVASNSEVNRLEKVEALLNAGADVNLVGPNSTPALSQSILEGDQKVFDLLMAHNPDIEVPDWDGSTPLMYAAANGHRPMIDALLQAGADLNRHDRHRLYPVDHALATGLSDTADYLRSLGGISSLDDIRTPEEANKLLKIAEVEETQDFFYFQVFYNNLFAAELMAKAGYKMDDRIRELIPDLQNMNRTEMLDILNKID
ncbi:ankyrin repeat domain-containing protein [Saccharibacillus alkalitolerans]|uniref:Ankyrin repeat domain-containing protein n=1 Tax=Saccharibacillus alkalitolerans TaxID=2705290 RepID=A0ABX0FD92_9BACL|nr:ankyrin repeat domain-containing protein [Saccharibacillus alkalitolerans]NGZ77624.1 ankyrin repeat domain-containing protein [Saccharibacillus alkalitolerans]